MITLTEVAAAGVGVLALALIVAGVAAVVALLPSKGDDPNDDEAFWDSVADDTRLTGHAAVVAAVETAAMRRATRTSAYSGLGPLG